jgi:TRAP-type mannitol/chloroaromatic compound transport system substrate-binding protein
MKKVFLTLITCLIMICFVSGIALAQAKKEERGKFGVDKRAASAQRITFKPSTDNTRWSMVMPWSKGLLFYDIASHMADSIRLASAGRLNIRVYAAEELVPAMQSFDAVSVGTAEVGTRLAGLLEGQERGVQCLRISALRTRWRGLQYLAV